MAEEAAEALLPSSETGKALVGRNAFVEELKEVSHIALPMIVVTLSQYLQRTSPLLMLGHLGELQLSSASIATSLCAVTGYSVLFGMSSALETLCGQAYGAGQYRKLGAFTYGAILCLFLVCIPISILWLLSGKFLRLIGQDPSIAAEAGKYAIWLIPTLFPYAILQSLVRYMQTQRLIIPMLWTAATALAVQLTICWAFIFKLDLGSAGAALSITVSYWFNVILILLYVKYSSTCKKTHAALALSKEVYSTMGEFFRFAVPSAVMACLEWWSFELIVLLSGILPNPKLETSVLSICLNTNSVHNQIPYSFGAAASVRVSNALGGGKPQAARVALSVVLILSATEAFIASITIFCCRYVWGYVFTYEQEVITYLKDITPLLCLSIFLDGTLVVLSGVARGTGWQHIGAYVNLGSYYLVGIPVALLLGFVLHLKGEGLWSGLVVGAFVQSIVLSLITGFTNWEKRAVEARQRMFNEQMLPQNDFLE
ncbi:protein DETOXIFICATION 14-like isoform X1 [Ipomoea triloba]|uniref:protein DETOXIFICATION 14-like isoform X1 n=1 Tax=Ipomoea triloba TaxID=35885 RepID=UPI00125DBB4B|nr:protein DETOXIFICATION 14-like isoform X1 [Ipomoea triloba]